MVRRPGVGSSTGAAGAGSVELTEGPFTLATQVLISDDNLILQGMGARATQLDYTGGATAALEITSYRHVYLADFWVNKLSGTGTKGIFFNYVDSVTSWKHSMKNINIVSADGSTGFDIGLHCNNIEHFGAENVIAFGGGTGIKLDNGGHSGSAAGINNVFTRCRAHLANNSGAWTGDGWHVEKQVGCQFLSCQALQCDADNAQFFLTNGCNSNVILGLDCEGAGTVGLFANGGAGGCQHNTFQVHFDTLTTGIKLVSADHNLILPGRQGSVTTPFSLDSGSDNNTIYPGGYAVTIAGSPLGNRLIGGTHERKGTGSITSGATTAVIAHGLAAAPTFVNVVFKEQGTADYGRWWVDTIDATNFTVNVSVDPGASNLDFMWEARV